MVLDLGGPSPPGVGPLTRDEYVISDNIRSSSVIIRTVVLIDEPKSSSRKTRKLSCDDILTEAKAHFEEYFSGRFGRKILNINFLTLIAWYFLV